MEDLQSVDCKTIIFLRIYCIRTNYKDSQIFVTKLRESITKIFNIYYICSFLVDDPLNRFPT